MINWCGHSEAIFRDDQDRLLFLMTLAETCEETAWQVHAKGYELLAQMAERWGESHSGEEWEETEKQKAQGIVRKELRRLGWREQELQEQPKCDGRKVEMAMELRRRTTMPLKWVAQRLNMGTWTNLSNLLSQQRQRGANE